MIGDELTKQEDRTLHRALESVVRTQFPNPRRNECPAPEVLRAIASKRIPMRDPAVDHVGQCSPCFSELTDLRRGIHRRNVLWKAGSAIAAIVVLAMLVSYIGFEKSSSGIAGPPVPPRHERAMVDLRNASTARSVQPFGSGFNQPPITIPRAILTLAIQLPTGSEAGAYEVQIRKPNQSANAAGKGGASIEDGITKLTLEIDTHAIPVGEYEFAWRMADSDWRSYAVLIR
jgi:hypothetical protein